MKKTWNLLMVAFLILPVEQYAQQVYMKVWRDEFNGTSLNRLDWRYSDCENQPSPPIAPNCGLITYYPQEHDPHTNIDIANNQLTLITKQESWLNTSANSCITGDCESNAFNYAYGGGKIWSNRLFKYGRYHLRYRIDNSPGLWPAWWLFSGGPNYYEEIDIFEYEGDKPNRITYNAWADDANGNRWSWGQKIRSLAVPWNSSNFISLEFDWTFNEFGGGRDHWRWREPGNVTWPPSGGTSPAVGQFLDAKAIIINNAFDPTHNNGSVPSGVTPKHFEVDYVQFEVWFDCSDVVNKPSYDFAFDGSYIAGGDVTLAHGGGSFIVSKGQSFPWWPNIGNGGYPRPDILEAIATNKVVLKPGFHAEPGSKFKAVIVSCTPTGYDNRTYAKANLSGSEDQDQILTENEDPFSLVQIFPNPTTDRFTISTSLLGTTDVIVSNLMGRVIDRQISRPDRNVEVNISDHPAGIYIVTISNEKGSKKAKIIKH